jgi:diaminopimelate decarboxylase
VTSRLSEIADEVGTPLYVYDAGVFRGRIARLREALGDAPHLVCYSAKANDSLALLALAGAEGLGVDIVSGGELFKTAKAGVPAGRIVFSGVGKRRDEIRAALAAGVRSINVESPGELDLVAEEARSLGAAAPVSIRLNPDVAADTHPAIATGSATSKFGLTPQAVLADLRRAAADPALEPVGISFHVGSQLLDPAPVLGAAGRAAELWRELAGDGIRLRDLDAGGGLGIPYDGEGEPDVEAYAAALVRVAGELDATLLLEPGRWLVGPAGTFLTRVEYVKDVPGRRIVICDGGMNDLIRPSLYGAFHPIWLVGDAAGRPSGPVDVVGPVCESGDFLARGRELPLPEPGDLLAIGSTGAYGRVMSSTYNARPLCAEALVDGDGWRLIRAAGTYEDLVRGEHL